MRAPTVRPSCHDCRCETIRYALDSNARTFRLCLIRIVWITSFAATVAVAVHGCPAALRAITEPTSMFLPFFR
jgi:hypothetical protein